MEKREKERILEKRGSQERLPLDDGYEDTGGGGAALVSELRKEERVTGAVNRYGWKGLVVEAELAKSSHALIRAEARIIGAARKKRADALLVGY